MVVQAQLNVTMPGWSHWDWFLLSCAAFFSISSLTPFLLSLSRTHNLSGVSPSKDDDYICTGVSVGDLSPDKVKLNISQSLTPLLQPDCLRCLLLCPRPRWSRNQGTPHDPQQMQEAQKNSIWRHMGLSASCHVQRPGEEDLASNKYWPVCFHVRARYCLLGQSTLSRLSCRTMLVSLSSLMSTSCCRCCRRSVHFTIFNAGQVHYAKPQQNDHSGLAVIVRQAKPTYTAGSWTLLLTSRLTMTSRNVPSPPVSFGNPSVYPGSAWGCELPSKLEVIIVFYCILMARKLPPNIIQVPDTCVCIPHSCP